MGRVRRSRLSVEEQAELWTRWKGGESPTDIGRALGCGQGAVPSCGGRPGQDSAARTDAVPPGPARRRARRDLARVGLERLAAAGRSAPWPCRSAQSLLLRTLVATKFARDWSPQQIAAWLRQTFPDDPCLHVSHETIYRSLFVQSRGALKRELTAHLRAACDPPTARLRATGKATC
jgi:hypothetical protein